MKKVWLIVAAALVVAGCLLCGGVLVAVMAPLDWDFTRLSEDETNRHEISEDFQNISIQTDTADIVFVPSDNDTTEIISHEQKNLYHSVEVKDGTLVIELIDTRRWYEMIGISFGSSKLTVSLPRGEYDTLTVRESTGDIKIPADFTFRSMEITTSTGHVTNRASVSGHLEIETSTGDIHVEDLAVGSMKLSVSTGHITASNVTCVGDIHIRVSTGDTRLTDVTCGNLTTEGSTGHLTMKNLVAERLISVERDTGDVKFDGCDAAEITVETDTGDVTGTLLSDKVFLAKTDTGCIRVPESVVGGKCSIKTDTGDILMDVVPLNPQ